MKKGIIVVLLLLFGVGAYGVATSETKPAQQTKTFSSIQSEVKLGAKLLDVRTPEEYRAGHFENADNFSLQNMQAGKLPNEPKDQKIFVYCQSGNRSAQAAAILKNAGYTNVIDLGGLKDVQASGGSLIR